MSSETNETYALALEKLNGYLAKHNCRKTQERETVLRAVCEMKGNFNLDELYRQMEKSDGIKVSRATLFNNMETLHRAAIVLKLYTSKCARYELQLSIAPCIYIYCEQCEKLQKLHKPDIAQHLRNIRCQQLNISQTVLCLSGTCKKCERALKRQAHALGDQPTRWAKEKKQPAHAKEKQQPAHALGDQPTRWAKEKQQNNQKQTIYTGYKND